jgi:hypothetical protein
MATPTTAEVLAKLRGYPTNLRWSDFRSVANSPHPPFLAQTHSRFSYGYSSEHKHGVYRIKGVSVTVTKGGVSMWAVTGSSRTDDLLKHEQGHFDITGLIARDLCRDLMSIEYDEIVLQSAMAAGNTARSQQTYANSVLAADVQRAVTEANDLQALLQGRETQGGGHTDGQYDDDTNHSQNSAGQQKWNDILQYARLNDTSLKLTMMIYGA